jgi:hypothetical protein
MDDFKETALIARLAARHGLSSDAVKTVLRALRSGGGSMAQFSHAEFGATDRSSRYLRVGRADSAHPHPPDRRTICATRSIPTRGDWSSRMPVGAQSTTLGITSFLGSPRRKVRMRH